MGFILLLIIFGVFKDVCHGCEAGYYFDNKQCQLCPNNCSICSSVSSCTVCKVGKYGTDCSSSCPKTCHDNVCNINSGICLSCEKGYYSDKNDSCVPCPDNCMTCSSDKYCFACKTAFRGVVCNETCFNCQHDTGCDKKSGYCFVNCTEGLSGELCNIKCDSKCKSCERLNEHECISCTDDENGKPCKIECLNRCLKETCNESGGSGDWGVYTGNQTCVSYCKEKVCNITSKVPLTNESRGSSITTTHIDVIVGSVIGSVVIIGIIGIIVVRRFNIKRSNCCNTSDDERPVKSSTPKTDGNTGEDDAPLLQITIGEHTVTTCSQTAQTARLAYLTDTHSQEETNPMKPKIQTHEQTESCDDKFQEDNGAKQNNTETNQSKPEFKEQLSKTDCNELTVKKDLLDAVNEKYTECDKIKPVEYMHSKSRLWYEFSKKEQIVKYLQDKLDQKQLPGRWDIDKTVVRVFGPDKELSEKIKNTLFEAMVEETVPVETLLRDLFNSEWWAEFLFDSQNKYPNKVEVFTEKQQKVIIIGTDEVVPEVKRMVMEFFDAKTDAIQCEPVVFEFISKYWIQDDFDQIRTNDVNAKTVANRLELRGPLDNLIKVKQELNLKLKAVCSKQYVLETPGIFTVLEAAKHSGTISAIEKEYKCLIKLPQEIDEIFSVKLNEYEAIDSEILDAREQNSGTYAFPICFNTRRHKIKLKLIQGDICQQKADIIVVEVPRNLKLRSDSNSFSWLNQGGSKLQANFNRLYPNGIQDGEVAVIDSEDFDCDKIYLTYLPSWKDAMCNDGMVLRNFIRECLRLADKNGKNTIAFSSTVTGKYLEYPMDMAVSIMYGAVAEFVISYNTTSLKEINIVMNVGDEDSIKAFMEHAYMSLYGASSVSTDYAGGKIKIELITGDLSTQKVDAILCIVSTETNQTTNTIGEFLVKLGGNSLEAVFKEKYPNKLDVGKVANISDGNLPCKTVLLTVLPTYSESSNLEKSLITALQAVFGMASAKGYQSVAIPALETGYPKTTEAICLYDAVLDWAYQNPNTSLEVVRFVMCSMEAEAQQVYMMCHLKAKGRETRANRKIGTIFIKTDEDSKYRMVVDGCAIGQIQLQVQVGDLLDNKADAIIIEVSANSDMKYGISQAMVDKYPNIGKQYKNKKNDLKKNGFVITDIAGFSAKHVIYVLFQDSLADWRSKIGACLEEANKKVINSVAFPVFGSGVDCETFPTDAIGECLFAAIDDFISMNPKSSVTDVRLVVPDSHARCVPSIIAALQDRTTAVNSRWGKPSTWKSILDEKFKLEQQDVAKSKKQTNQSKDCPVTVAVHSDDDVNIDRCIKALDDRIGLQYATKVVDLDKDVISYFTDIQIHSVIDLYMVDLKVDKIAQKCTIIGPLPNVLAAVNFIENKMLQYKLEDNNSAKVLFDKTVWHWLWAHQFALEKEVSYDVTANFIIESAYKEGKQAVELQFDNGKTYVIDFNKMVEYPKVNINDSVRVIRKDIIKGDQIVLPTTWSDTENGIQVPVIYYPEYKKVKDSFLGGYKNGEENNSRSVKVVKIERIQNRTLYEQYVAKKTLMEQQKSGCKQIERLLWHETAEDNIRWIVNHGFNRSYCGVHKDAYGQGVYFAADAFCAAHSDFAENKSGAKRHMFLAKVLTGELTKGESSMRFLPPIDSAKRNVMYDSAVDNMSNPMEFVIFHATQAYPEYLITYTST